MANRGSGPGDHRGVLTNRQGHPVYDNQNQRTVGARGPATQELSDAEQERLANLGKNGPRDVEGLQMTHCVPNERVVVQR